MDIKIKDHGDTITFQYIGEVNDEVIWTPYILGKTYGDQRQVSLYLYMPIIGRHIYLGTVYEIPATQPVEEVVDYWIKEMEIFGTRPLHTFDKLHKMFVIFAIKNNLTSPDIDTIYAPFYRIEKILNPKVTDADQWY